jgi:hypothetical protein
MYRADMLWCAEMREPCGYHEGYEDGVEDQRKRDAAIVRKWVSGGDAHEARVADAIARRIEADK